MRRRCEILAFYSRVQQEARKSLPIAEYLTHYSEFHSEDVIHGFLFLLSLLLNIRITVVYGDADGGQA